MKADFISVHVHIGYSTASEQLTMCWEITVISLRCFRLTYFLQWRFWWEIKEESSSIFHLMKKMLSILSRLLNTVNRYKIWYLFNTKFFILFFLLFLFHRLICLSPWSKCQNSYRMESFQFMWVAVILHLKISGKGKFNLGSLENTWIVPHLLPASLLPCLTRGRFKSVIQNEAFL